MEFITLRPLVVPLLCSGVIAQGLWVMNSVDPKLLKSNYYLKKYNYSKLSSYDLCKM